MVESSSHAFAENGVEAKPSSRVFMSSAMAQGLQSDDQEAWSDFVGGSFDALCAFARSRGVASANAPDVVQEALASFWQKASALDMNQNPLGYLLTAVARKGISLKRKGRREVLASELTSSDPESGRKIDPLDTFPANGSALDDEVVTEVRFQDAMDMLPPTLREPLQRSLDGYTHKEIARKLKKSPAAIKISVSRAKHALREVLVL